MNNNPQWSAVEFELFKL